MENSKEIFNVVLNAKDVNTYNKMPQEEKAEWIKKNTNQKDDNLINAFVYGKDISTGVSAKTPKSPKPAIIRKTGSTDSNEGQNTENREDK